MRKILFLVFLMSACLNGLSVSAFGKQQTGETAEVGLDSPRVEGPAEPLIFAPDPMRTNLFADSLKKLIIVDGPTDMARWMAFADSLASSRFVEGSGLDSPPRLKGEAKVFRETWVVGVLVFLALFLGVVRYTFPNDLSLLIQAYYQEMILNQISKEDNLLISWPSIFLFVLSGLSLGLFIYLALLSGQWGSYPYGGVDDFLFISVVIMVLFALKILCLRFVGIFFEGQKTVRQYVVVLYLSYFNAGLIGLPAALTLAFLPFESASWLVPVIAFLVMALLIFRVFKFLASMLYNYRFSKFYLFVYLCSLEIAPILILLKVVFR